MLPTITVAILNHNYAQYVGEAIASALLQEPGDYLLDEVVVVDDGSTDHSHHVYGRFDGIRVVNQPNQGFGAALTRAVAESNADWIAFCDADDAFEAAKLRTIATHIAKPEISLLQHAEYVVDAHGAPYRSGRHPGGSTSTLAVRTEPARDLLPVTNEMFFHVFADVGQGAVMREPLTRYRVHDRSMTDRDNPGVFAEYLAQVCDDVATRIGELAEAPRPWATRLQLEVLTDTYRQRASNHRAEAQRQIRRGAIR